MSGRGWGRAGSIVRRVGLALGVAGCACINDDVRLFEVELRAQLEVPASVTGAARLHVEVHHAQASEGHPLGLIAAFTVEPESGQAPASFVETVLVPTDEGEGLIVYAWIDLDDDGVLCGLDGAGIDEPAGLLELDAFPAHELAFDLPLDAACVGPEGLFP